MGNIETELKKNRRKAHKQIIFNNACQAVLPAIIVAAISFFILFAWKCISTTYQVYWQLFIHSLKVIINILPEVLAIEVIAYFIMFGWASIVDIINYNKAYKK